MSERSILIDTANELGAELGIEEKLTSRANKTSDEIRELIAERQIALERATAPDAPKPMTHVAKPAVPGPPARKPIDGTNPRARVVGGPPKYAFQVPPARELKCKRGVLRAGEEVRPKDVGGQKQLDELVKARKVQRGPLANQPNHGHRRT